MAFTTKEGGFEYQAEQIFDEMRSDYIDECDELKANGESSQIKTFSDWLWNNQEDLGRLFYERLDSWCGIDQMTEKYNETC
jgi:hypothetical protein